MDANLIEKIKTLTPEQRSQMAQVIQTELASRGENVGTSIKPRGFLPTATGVIENLPSIASTILKGKPIESTTTDINDFIAKERIKKELKDELEPQTQKVSIIDPTTKELTTIDAPAGKVFSGREGIEGEYKQRQGRFQFDRLDNFGGQVNEEGLQKFNETVGFDLKPELEAGRGIPTIDKEGNRNYRVLSQDEWKRKVSEGKFDSSEIEHLQQIQNEIRSWGEVVKGLGELGIDAKTAGNVEFDLVNSPIGPLSIPARFNLAGQYMQDPKYTALKRKIERAFQAFRQRVTGAQASDRELKMLRPLIASLKDRPEVFFETIGDLMGEAKMAGQDRLNIYQMAGRDISGFKGLFDETLPDEDIENISNISPKENTSSIPTIGQSFQGGTVKAIRLKR